MLNNTLLKNNIKSLSINDLLSKNTIRIIKPSLADINNLKILNNIVNLQIVDFNDSNIVKSFINKNNTIKFLDLSKTSISSLDLNNPSIHVKFKPVSVPDNTLNFNYSLAKHSMDTSIDKYKLSLFFPSTYRNRTYSYSGTYTFNADEGELTNSKLIYNITIDNKEKHQIVLVSNGNDFGSYAYFPSDYFIIDGEKISFKGHSRIEFNKKLNFHLKKLHMIPLVENSNELIDTSYSYYGTFIPEHKYLNSDGTKLLPSYNVKVYYIPFL